MREKPVLMAKTAAVLYFRIFLSQASCSIFVTLLHGHMLDVYVRKLGQ